MTKAIRTADSGKCVKRSTWRQMIEDALRPPEQAPTSDYVWHCRSPHERELLGTEVCLLLRSVGPTEHCSTLVVRLGCVAGHKG